jgi:hypothetical protein
MKTFMRCYELHAVLEKHDMQLITSHEVSRVG